MGVPAGAALWRLVGRDRAATRRLEVVGVRATAEIRALTLAASDETDTCEVVMRISGPGLAPFEVRQNRAGGADMRVGARPRALVDPSDRSCAFPDRPTVR
ncbi:hypothetical protein PZB75_13705 [Streptomyces sp. AM 4-1-1]|uniref:hypothetical protein n=1 Tax=Streptomyces sp. AM 4-1-1 TaxID=3028710 RepID=UPI0023B9A276|nr:hypothetical protein [Streptomyces sp. AM 4-1-1]WEH34318.1 hypothetical protein PZB75_13705 [Streptomyces sp. AM 4-1-1]